MIDVLGYLGTLLIIIAYLPQTIKTVKTRNTCGVSSGMYTLVIISAIVWIVYATLINNVPLIVCNGLNLIQAIFILRVIYLNRKK